jgi:PD-(D/E)XK endonuclease
MVELTPSQKGAAAEAAITAAVIQLGLTVLRPLCEGRRYDLIVDLEPALLRVQCKLARRLDVALAIHLQTNRYTPAGYVSTSYTPAEVDAIAAYSPALRRSFLTPIGVVAGSPLHSSPPESGTKQSSQRDHLGARLRARVGSTDAAAVPSIIFAGRARLPRPDHGAIAQLGERRAGSAKVVGSSPTSSIDNGGNPDARPARHRRSIASRSTRPAPL